MPLNQEQQEAVEYLDGPLLVLAGPGTGKTQLLSAKVAYILENTDASPENILCLTFTEAGAENMRTRLQSMIGKAALDVNIYTYHAFGANLLERYKNYAETFDRKLDVPIDETVQYKIIHDLQQKLPATDILKDAETRDIIETISNAKAARLTAVDLAKVAEQNLEDSQALSAEISPILLAYQPRCKFEVAIQNTYQPILEVLVKYTSKTPIVNNIERTANVLARDLNQIIERLQNEGKPKLKDLSAWKTANFERTDNVDTAYRLTDHIANKKLLSLAHLMEQYDERLRRDGLFDFNDMIECTIECLKTDNGFRLSLSELFQYILLDEFQDTNASQFELIKLLTDYEKPTVMAVGDDDQAIYEFQGANASNLMDFQKHYDAKVITLVKNYRSTSEILDLSRQIAAQIEDSFAKNYQVDKTLHSMKEVGQTASQPAKVFRHEFPGSEAEYFWIASEIRKLVDAGVNPNEIAILAPKHKNIAPILPYLKAQNLNVSYEKRDNLLLDTRMHQLITLAKFINALANNEQPSHQLLEILSFDFWELPPFEVLQAVASMRGAHKTTLEYLTDHTNLTPIAKFFADLTTAAFSAPLELWLDYLIGNQSLNDYTSPFLSYHQQHMNQAELLELYENLATLRQTLLAHAKSLSRSSNNFTPTLKDFVSTIEDYEIAGAEITRISVYRDHADAIQVMTSHKSKGLEYRYVFLTSVDDASWGKAKGNNNRLSLPKNLVQIRHTGISDDERLRLFFVAITRAKEALIMTNAISDQKGAEVRRLRYLCESGRSDAEQVSHFLPKDPEIKIHTDDLTDEQKIRTLRLDWISHYQKLTPDITALLKARMQNYRLTASDLTTFVDLTYAGPQVLYERKVLRAPEEPPTLPMCYGNLLHAVFEQITSHGLTDSEALAFFQTEAPKALLSAQDRLDLLEKGQHSLSIALREFGPILRHEHAKAEVNLSPERLNFNGTPLTGKIDHLEIDPVAKTIEVYDFKTGKYHDQKWDRQPSLFKYRLQLGFYKLLLNLSSTYAKYHVTKGHILFVTPDSDDKVYDKVYEFNDADDAELKNLIQAVYHQLSTLEFVQNPEFFLPADKNNTMPKIREFIAKLLEIAPKD